MALPVPDRVQSLVHRLARELAQGPVVLPVVPGVLLLARGLVPAIAKTLAAVDAPGHVHRLVAVDVLDRAHLRVAVAARVGVPVHVGMPVLHPAIATVRAVAALLARDLVPVGVRQGVRALVS